MAPIVRSSCMRWLSRTTPMRFKMRYHDVEQGEMCVQPVTAMLHNFGDRLTTLALHLPLSAQIWEDLPRFSLPRLRRLVLDLHFMIPTPPPETTWTTNAFVTAPLEYLDLQLHENLQRTTFNLTLSSIISLDVGRYCTSKCLEMLSRCPDIQMCSVGICAPSVGDDTEASAIVDLPSLVALNISSTACVNEFINHISTPSLTELRVSDPSDPDISGASLQIDTARILLDLIIRSTCNLVTLRLYNIQMDEMAFTNLLNHVPNLATLAFSEHVWGSTISNISIHHLIVDPPKAVLPNLQSLTLYLHFDSFSDAVMNAMLQSRVSGKTPLSYVRLYFRGGDPEDSFIDEFISDLSYGDNVDIEWERWSRFK